MRHGPLASWLIDGRPLAKINNPACHWQRGHPHRLGLPSYTRLRIRGALWPSEQKGRGPGPRMTACSLAGLPLDGTRQSLGRSRHRVYRGCQDLSAEGTTTLHNQSPVLNIEKLKARSCASREADPASQGEAEQKFPPDAHAEPTQITMGLWSVVVLA